MPDNQLFYGDNLDVIRRHIADESVDLVYLDPPFKSNQDYNVLFAEKDGSQAAAQIKAFEDTWEWNMVAALAFQETVEIGGPVSQVMQAFRTFLGDSDMLAYLSMMAPRLKELRRVLKVTGSIYLHCDVTASAHLRLLMDAVFGPQNFRNEIIWYYYNKMHDSRKRLFPRAHDTVLFYVKDVASPFTYHQLKEMRDKPFKQLLRKKVDGRMVNVKDASGHTVTRLKLDRTLDNVWRIPCLQPAASEKLGYPTQKPESLLERIISASSDDGDVVLDPFCGCGTSIAAAQRLKRKWIGIDITHLAITLIKHRLRDAFGTGIRKTYTVLGEPVDLDGAQQLASSDPYQFQWWALGLVGARPVEQKKGADKGIDGRIYFHDEGEAGKTKQVILSVKAGSTGPNHIRDLHGVVEREKAAIGVLITMETPTKPMKKEAASASVYAPLGPAQKKYPKIQIITVEELLDGKSIDMPPWHHRETFKQAPKAERGKAHHQPEGMYDHDPPSDE